MGGKGKRKEEKFKTRIFILPLYPYQDAVQMSPLLGGFLDPASKAHGETLGTGSFQEMWPHGVDKTPSP